MTKDLLTKADYRHLFIFTRRLYLIKSDFLNQSLTLLSQCFGYQLCAASIFEIPKKHERVNMHTMKSPYFTDDLLKQSMKAAINDKLLYPYLLNAKNNNDWQGVVYSQDMPNFKQTTFYQVFKDSHIVYAAYLSVQDQPDIIFYVLKNDQEKAFSAREKQLLEKICHVLREFFHEIIVSQFERIIKNSLANLLDRGNNIGVLILDQSQSLIYYNQQFFDYIFPHYHITDHNFLVQTFIKAVEEKKQTGLADLSPNIQLFDNLQMRITYLNLPEKQDLGKEYYLCKISKTSTPHLNSVRLTEREKEVWHLLAKGEANKEIASQLNISEHTVKSHVSHLFSKLAINSRNEAARLWTENH